jgi:uncharacterized oxidoreductase
MAAGSPQEEAETVTRLLVEANMVGHDSHGVIRIPQYLTSINNGDVQVGARVEVVQETAVALVLDGHWGFGQVIAERAVRMGVGKAKAAGLAAVTIRNSNHIGRLGSYVEDIARQGLIGLLFANAHGAAPSVVPWGGRHGRLATNPLAAGIPRSSGEPIVLDMTTSIVAEGKVRVKRNRGEPVPEGWIVDPEGEPTTDAKAFYGPPRGSILPFGGSAGYKGYGLSVAVDLLAGALSGAGCTGTSTQIGNAVLMLILDVAAFVPAEDFDREVEEFSGWVKSSPPAAGFEEILFPGDIENRERERRGREGIFVEEETWRQIAGCGADLGVDVQAIAEAEAD